MLLKTLNLPLANQKTYTQDGVCLTESGMCQLQSLVVPSSSTRRGQNRRPKPKLKLKIINQNSVAVLQSPLDPHYLELSRDGYMDNNRGKLTSRVSQMVDCMCPTLRGPGAPIRQKMYEKKERGCLAQI